VLWITKEPLDNSDVRRERSPSKTAITVGAKSLDKMMEKLMKHSRSITNEDDFVTGVLGALKIIQNGLILDRE
jgi:hypothetical protein